MNIVIKCLITLFVKIIASESDTTRTSEPDVLKEHLTILRKILLVLRVFNLVIWLGLAQSLFFLGI